MANWSEILHCCALMWKWLDLHNQTNVYEIRIGNDAGSNGGRVCTVNHWIFLHNQLYPLDKFWNFYAMKLFLFFHRKIYVIIVDTTFSKEIQNIAVSVHTSLHFMKTLHWFRFFSLWIDLDCWNNSLHINTFLSLLKWKHIQTNFTSKLTFHNSPKKP